MVYCMQGRQGKLQRRIAKHNAVKNTDLGNLVAVHFIEALCYFGIEKVLPKRKGQEYKQTLLES